MLLYIFLLAWMAPFFAENVLLIGDSIDRYVVVDWCAKHNATVLNWGDDSIKYGDKGGTKKPSAYCELENGDSLAFLHIFGSSGSGPYLFISTRDDPFAATTRRLIKALELYREQIGFHKLTKIIFHSSLWDFRPFRSDVCEYRYEQDAKIRAKYSTISSYRQRYLLDHGNRTLAHMQHDIIARIFEIVQLVTMHHFNDPNHHHNHTNVHHHTLQNLTIGVRTAIWYEDGNELLHAMNDLMRMLVLTSNGVSIDAASSDYPATSLPTKRYIGYEPNITTLLAHPSTYYTTHLNKYWKQLYGHNMDNNHPMLHQSRSFPRLALYDLDAELWSAVNYNYTHHAKLFRDEHHPTVAWAEYIGNVYMGYNTSKQYFPPLLYDQNHSVDDVEKRETLRKQHLLPSWHRDVIY